MRVTIRIMGFGSLTDTQPSPSIHATIPPVFNCIVTTTMETPSNFGPSLSHVSDETFDEFTFLRCDGLMVEGWLEVLVIPFSALFRGTRSDHLRYPNPVMRSMNLDKVEKLGVLMCGPRPSSVVHDDSGGGW